MFEMYIRYRKEVSLKADSILFDLDGTIWDSTEPAAVVWNQVAKRNPSISDKVTGEGLKKVYGLVITSYSIHYTKLYDLPDESGQKISDRS